MQKGALHLYTNYLYIYYNTCIIAFISLCIGAHCNNGKFVK